MSAFSNTLTTSAASTAACCSWVIQLTARFDLGQSPQRLYRLQMQLAERLVFPKWRDVFGGRLKACICGGAASPVTW
jgi:long-chain acyl-CoA synthetase